MSTKPNPEHTPHHHVTATITIAGTQRPAISSHGDGGTGSFITLGLPGIAIWLRDQRTVDTWAKMWNASAGQIYADRLPEHRPLPRKTGAGTVTVAIAARHTDTTMIAPRGDALTIRTGPVTWAVLDRAAFYGQLRTWDTVLRLADIVLPLIDLTAHH